MRKRTAFLLGSLFSITLGVISGVLVYNGLPDAGVRAKNKLHKFVRKTPKVELHAHLNGSIRNKTLRSLCHATSTPIPSVLISDSYRSLSTCFAIFPLIHKLVNKPAVLRRVIRETLKDFYDDNVYYLELRTTPRQLQSDDTKQADNAAANDNWLHPGGIEAYVEIVLEEFERWEARPLPAEDEGGVVRPNMVPRLLISIDRAAPVSNAEASVDMAIDLYKSGNRFVVGVEIGGNPTIGSFSTFQPILQKARDAGLKISVHCGETDAAPEEVLEMIRFRPDRLGHALFIPEEGLKLLEDDPIPIECCPTSNVMTLELASASTPNNSGSHRDAVVEGLKLHPTLKHWLAIGYPISISTDDSGVFNTSPTQELALLCDAFSLNEWALTGTIWTSVDHVFEPSRRVRSRLARDVSLCIKRLLRTLERDEKGKNPEDKRIK